MQEVFVKDNFLSKKDLDLLQSTLLYNDMFPWYYQDFKVFDKNYKSNTDSFVTQIYDYQFTHVFSHNYKIRSDYYSLLYPFLETLKPVAVTRAKANLTLAAPTIMDYGFHIDFPNIENVNISNMKTAIFYVNTNDGYTLFEGGNKINSVENRLVYFNTCVPHAGTTTTDKRRVVINVNYFG